MMNQPPPPNDEDYEEPEAQAESFELKKVEKKEKEMNEKDEKILNNAIENARNLSITLESLDFQIERFSKFDKKLQKFKIWTPILLSLTSVFAGAVVGSVLQTEFNKYKIIQMLEAEKNKMSKISQVFKKNNVNVQDKNGKLQIYTETRDSVTVAEQGKWSVLTIKTGEIK